MPPGTSAASRASNAGSVSSRATSYSSLYAVSLCSAPRDGLGERRVLPEPALGPPDRQQVVHVATAPCGSPGSRRAAAPGCPRAAASPPPARRAPSRSAGRRRRRARGRGGERRPDRRPPPGPTGTRRCWPPPPRRSARSPTRSPRPRRAARPTGRPRRRAAGWRAWRRRTGRWPRPARRARRRPRLRPVIRSTSAGTSGAATPGSRTMDPVGTGLVDTTAVVVSGGGVAEVARVGPDEHVERQVAARRADPVGGPELGGVVGDAQVRGDRPGLLRQPGLVDAVHREPVADRRRAEHLVDRDDAGAADACQEHVAAGRALDVRHGRRLAAASGRAVGPRPARLDRHERRAVARPGSSSRCCRRSGRCGSCGPARSRPAAPTGSCSSPRSRRSPRTPPR